MNVQRPGVAVDRVRLRGGNLEVVLNVPALEGRHLATLAWWDEKEGKLGGHRTHVVAVPDAGDQQVLFEDLPREVAESPVVLLWDEAVIHRWNGGADDKLAHASDGTGWSDLYNSGLVRRLLDAAAFGRVLIRARLALTSLAQHARRRGPR
jgi:hypothetical protein